MNRAICRLCVQCAVRWRAEYAECALKEEMMWLRTRDSHRAQFPCHGAQPGKGQPGHGIVWYLMELCGIVCFCVKLYINVWYCMVLHSHRGPVSLPWGTSKQGSARAWEGKRLSLSLQICALYCTSNGVYVHRAISCVSTNPKSKLLMFQYHCGLWFLPCAVWPAHVQVHCAPPSQASHGSAVSWILVSFASSPSTALSPWEQPGRGSVKFECILSLSSGEACARKILDFLEEGLHYRRRRVLWLCSISTSGW